MEKKKTLKNYLTLLLIICFTCILSLYVFSFCKQYKEIKLGTPVITEVLSEVKYDNLDSFLYERDFVVLYMCTTSEVMCRNFEVKLKKFIVDNNLSDDIVYLNLGDYSVNNNLLYKVYTKYKHKDLIKKINNYPTFLIFSDGKIIDLLSPNKKESLSIENVKDFFEGYELLND